MGSTIINAIGDGIKNGWNAVTKFFEEKVKPMFTKQYWIDLLNNVKEGIKSAFNGIIGIVEKAVNSIINKINKLSWEIPDWVPGVGGETFGFDISPITIPRGVFNVKSRAFSSKFLSFIPNFSLNAV